MDPILDPFWAPFRRVIEHLDGTISPVCMETPLYMYGYGIYHLYT